MKSRQPKRRILLQSFDNSRDEFLNSGVQEGIVRIVARAHGDEQPESAYPHSDSSRRHWSRAVSSRNQVDPHDDEGSAQ